MGAPKQPFASLRLPMMVDESGLLDEDNPFSLLELCPPPVREAMEKLDTKFYKISELQLRKLANPSAEIARLRMSFWDEYLRASAEKRKMDVRSITRGVCSHNYFYEVILQNENWVGYITTPPADYQLAIREMLELSWDRIREVLLLPITEKVSVRRTIKNEDGKIEMHIDLVEKPNTSLIAEIRQITNMLDLRVKGAIMQKMQITQKNLNVNMNADDPNIFLADATMAQLEAMEKKITRMRGSMEEVEMLDAAKDSHPEETVLDIPCGSNLAEESVDAAAEENQREKTVDN